MLWRPPAQRTCCQKRQCCSGSYMPDTSSRTQLLKNLRSRKTRSLFSGSATVCHYTDAAMWTWMCLEVRLRCTCFEQHDLIVLTELHESINALGKLNHVLHSFSDFNRTQLPHVLLRLDAAERRSVSTHSWSFPSGINQVHPSIFLSNHLYTKTKRNVGKTNELISTNLFCFKLISWFINTHS